MTPPASTRIAISPQAQALLDNFASQAGVSSDHVGNLTATINASPALTEQFNQAVAAGHLKQFQALPANVNAGGDYNSATQAMRLPLSMLASPASGLPYNAAEATFVLGHELQHGFNAAASQQSVQDFTQQVQAIARSRGSHDYTQAIDGLIDGYRRNEASAHLAGWNALVDSVRNQDPQAGLAQIHAAHPGRAGDFITRSGMAPNYSYALRPGLSLDADMHLPLSQDNIRTMGGIYFDKPGNQARLGAHGDSDYANYYGAWAIGVIGQYEKALAGNRAGISLDMTQLRINEAQMERNGISFGNNTTPVPYTDTGVQPPYRASFDHTSGSHQHVPIVRADLTLSLPGLPDQLLHGDGHGHSHSHDKHQATDDPLLAQIRQGVQGHPVLQEKSADPLHHNLLALARDHQLQHVDHVLLGRDGRHVILVQGQLQDPAHQRAAVPLEAALQADIATPRAQAEVPAMTDNTALLAAENTQARVQMMR